MMPGEAPGTATDVTDDQRSALLRVGLYAGQTMLVMTIDAGLTTADTSSG
jgi:hypothetical protein